MKDPYLIYVEAYGKVQSGGKLTRVNDYGEHNGTAFVDYDERRHLAVSLAAQDVKVGKPLRSKADFEKEIDRLLGSK